MYDVLSEFVGKYKKAIVSISICVACVFAAFYAGYLCGIRNVSNIGTGTGTIRKKLEQAGAAVENAASGIDQAADTAAKVSDGITAAQESAQYIQHAADDSAAIIADCKFILATIRSRSQKGTTAH